MDPKQLIKGLALGGYGSYMDPVTTQSISVGVGEFKELEAYISKLESGIVAFAFKVMDLESKK